MALFVYILLHHEALMKNRTLSLSRLFAISRNKQLDSSTNNELFAAQIRALYDQIPIILSVEAINASLVFLILTFHHVGPGWPIFWITAMALTVIRALGWGLYRTKARIASTAKWAGCAAIGSALSGLLWGVSSAALLPSDIAGQAFVAFAIGIMCTVPLVSFSYYLPSLLAYVIPAILPLAGRLVLNNAPVTEAMGHVLLLFAVAITLAGWSSSRAFAALLRLNFDLGVRTKALGDMNGQLAKEIAQRNAAEGHLRQAQKMEAMGQLTGGIAHDFNNLLTGVIGNLELASRRAADDPRMIELLHAACRAAERGSSLTRHLLAFGRKQNLEPRAVAMSAVVGNVEKLLKQTIGPDVRLITAVQDNLMPAWVDQGELEVAILNLAINARDAMPNGGELRIEAGSPDGENKDIPEKITLGGCITVSVTDTGVGMSDATLARAFEPFFTTKELGRGSGLGLSLVQGFVAQSAGTVRVCTSPGKGTRVVLCLPVAPNAITAYADIDIDCSTSSIEPRGGRVLVCDDDHDVRTFVMFALEESGFIAFEAAGPSAALEMLEREEIDLLLVDHAMPEMTGLALIERVRSRFPGLKTLLMTGHAEVLRSGAPNGIPLLKKPFKIADLTTQIADILDASSSHCAAGSPQRPALEPAAV